MFVCLTDACSEREMPYRGNSPGQIESERLGEEMERHPTELPWHVNCKTRWHHLSPASLRAVVGRSNWRCLLSSKASKNMPSFKNKILISNLLRLTLLFTAGLIFPWQVNAALGSDSERIGEIGRNEKLVAQFVWQMMERNHLSKHGLDDEISRRAFDKYINSLDPAKLYFRQSDIEEFSRWKTQLDDQLKSSDYSAAFQIFGRFLDRVDQQTKLAIECLDAQQDFSVNEEMIVDPELAHYAKDDAEAQRYLAKMDQVQLAGASRQRRQFG